MSVPTHDPSCRTKVWETSCPDCGQHVYFFLCSCGSKVFFDALGDPWPQHRTTCLAVPIRALRDSRGLSLDDVQRMVTEEASRRGAKLPANVKTIFQSLNYKETGRGTLLTLTPGSEAREFTGTVSGTNQLVNFFKRHKIDDTPTARGLLGDLVSEEHRDIYMKGETNPRTGFRPQIEAVVKKSLLDRVHVSLGVRFTARVIPRSLPGGVRLWVVEELWNGEAEDG